MRSTKSRRNKRQKMLHANQKSLPCMTQLINIFAKKMNSLHFFRIVDPGLIALHHDLEKQILKWNKQYCSKLFFISRFLNLFYHLDNLFTRLFNKLLRLICKKLWVFLFMTILLYRTIELLINRTETKMESN